MKRLKLIYLLSAVLVGFAFTACSDSDDDEETSGDIVLSTTAMAVAKDGETRTLSVRSAKEPTVTCDQSWVTVTLTGSTVSGTYTYSVVIDANTDTEERVATITVAVGSSSGTVTVTQAAADGLVVSPTEYADVPAEGLDITVELTTNGDYSIDIDVEWITNTTDESTVTSSGTDVLTFTVAVNVGEARTGIITFTLNELTQTVTVSQLAAEVTEITSDAWDIAKLMYPGWNLGNTLEASGTGLAAETSWQSTKTTQTLIDYVASCGFKSVRIPCSWYSHFDSGTTTVNSEWMTRVKEVVDYCIADGLYVILNDHYDLGWLENSFSDVSSSNVAAKSDTLKAIWTQVAETFVNYDEHLLFAGLNEPAASTSSQVTALVTYEQAFIDAVRATGGNNALRTLVVQGPVTDIDNTYKLFTTLPTDDVDNRLMVEVHYYSPWQFCGLEEDASWGVMQYYFSSDNHVSGSSRNVSTSYEESYISSQFAKMKTMFADKGYPLILGEYGCLWRDVSSDGDQDKHNASVKAFHKAVNMYAVNNGMIPFVWDTNYTSQPTMTVIQRSNCSIYNQYAMEGILEGVNAATWPY